MIWSGQAPEHDTDHSEANEGGDGSGVVLEIAAEAPTPADPGKGSLDHPPFGQ